MAIDSARKRYSALNYRTRRRGRLLPDGAISGVDRQDAAGFYRGVTALLFAVTLSAASVTQPTITASVTQLTATASVTQPTLSSVTVKNDIT